MATVHSDGDAAARRLLAHSVHSCLRAGAVAPVLLAGVATALSHYGASRWLVSFWMLGVLLGLAFAIAVLSRLRQYPDASPTWVSRRLSVVQFVTGTSWAVVALVDEPGRSGIGAVLVASTVMVMCANLIACAATPGPFLAMHAPLTVLTAIGLARAGDGFLALLICLCSAAVLSLRTELHPVIARGVAVPA